MIDRGFEVRENIEIAKFEGKAMSKNCFYGENMWVTVKNSSQRR